MAVNTLQKIVLLDIEPATQTIIEQRLQQGYVIQFIVSLVPVYNKLLIVYSQPKVIFPDEL